MTTLAHDAALLGISIDSGRLFDGSDPLYALWLVSVVERVYATREEQRRMTKGG